MRPKNKKIKEWFDNKTDIETENIYDALYDNILLAVYLNKLNERKDYYEKEKKSIEDYKKQNLK
jgi:hypothetical protein